MLMLLMSCLSVYYPSPSTYLPTRSSLSLPLSLSLARRIARSLARHDVEHAALLATRAGRQTVGVPVYDDHISQSRGLRSDDTGECALRSHYVIVCLIESDHTRLAGRGGDCHWGIAHLLSGAWSLGWFGRVDAGCRCQ